MKMKGLRPAYVVALCLASGIAAAAQAVASVGLEGQSWWQERLGSAYDEPSGAAVAGACFAMVVAMVAKATRRR